MCRIDLDAIHQPAPGRHDGRRPSLRIARHDGGVTARRLREPPDGPDRRGGVRHDELGQARAECGRHRPFELRRYAEKVGQQLALLAPAREEGRDATTAAFIARLEGTQGVGPRRQLRMLGTGPIEHHHPLRLLGGQRLLRFRERPPLRGEPCPLRLE